MRNWRTVCSVLSSAPILIAIAAIGAACDDPRSPSTGDHRFDHRSSQTGGAGAAAGGGAGGEAGVSERSEPPGHEAARARATALLSTFTQADKLSLVQGVEGSYVGNVQAVGSLPALTLQDGPAGVTRLTGVTAFPAPITLAATWDRELVRRWAAAMAAEQRGKGVMVMLAPMINLARVPAAGRNFEGFGEDPFLAAELVAADVEGIQSQKVVATAKHFIANEQETNRTSEDSQIDERTLREVYDLPFESSVRAGVGAIMCSYNRIHGTYACEDAVSLGRLKNDMGFTGWVMSDWGATHSTIAAANAGLDMEMPDGQWFGRLGSAIDDGTVPQARLDDMVSRIVGSLARVGVLDDPPLGSVDSVVTSEEHTAIALEAATSGITLLRNERAVLPLGPTVRSIAVIGSAAADEPFSSGGGSAFVNPPYVVSALEAIKGRAAPNVAVTYARGDGASIEEAVEAARAAEVAVIVASVWSTEGEDRPSLALSPETDAVISAVAAINSRTIVFLHVPGAVLMPWLDQVSAVVVGWYPGQENGRAIASVLFGDTNPSGKLPLTFPKDAATLPSPNSSDVVSYSEGLAIGYRWLDAKGIDPLFAFGHGLSYTTFEYSTLNLLAGSTPGAFRANFVIRNTGSREGTEIAQLYVGYPSGSGEPPRVLRGFQKVRLAAGESQPISMLIEPTSLRCWDAAAHAHYIPSGTYEISIGRSSRDLPLVATIEIH